MVDSLLDFKHLHSKAFKQRKDQQKEKQKVQHNKQSGSRDLPLLQIQSQNALWVSFKFQLVPGRAVFDVVWKIVP